MGGGNGGFHFGFAGQRHLFGDHAQSGVIHIAESAAGSGNPPAGDKVRNFPGADDRRGGCFCFHVGILFCWAAFVSGRRKKLQRMAR